MLVIFKNVFLFIGAMIGAGFATGAELMVFFSDGSLWSVLLSGLFTAVLSFVFCLFGRIGSKSKVFDRTLSVAIYLSSIITFIAMIGGANLIMQEGFNIKLIGFISGLIVSVIAIFNMDKIKIMNLIIMPIVIILIAVMASKTQFELTNATVSVTKSITYVGMNLLLAGFLLADGSKEMNIKQSAICCLIIGIVITVLIAVMLNISMQGGGGMPVIDFARQIGYNNVATVIVYCAIITTMIGAAKIIHDKTALWLAKDKVNARHKFMSCIYMLLLTIVVANCDFDTIVKTLYPLTGYAGVIVCIAISIRVIMNYISMVKKKAVIGNKSSGKQCSHRLNSSKSN